MFMIVLYAGYLEHGKEENCKQFCMTKIYNICRKLYDRGVLDGFLARALNVEPDEKTKRISLIDDSAYVLTLDYTIKMLNIHERYECGVPVIIEGETGVGKTALVEMLSKLWNQSLLSDWTRKRGRIIDFFQRRLGEIEIEVSGNYQVYPSKGSAI